MKHKAFYRPCFGLRDPRITNELNKITTIMSNSQRQFQGNQHDIENVQEYVFLGHFTKFGKGNQTLEIAKRTKLGWTAVRKLRWILENQ